MSDARRNLRLPAKARVLLAIVGRDAEQHLDGDALARQAQMLGRPHRAHAALAEEIGDLVGLRQDRADADLGSLLHRPPYYTATMQRYLPWVALLWAGCAAAGAAEPSPAPADVADIKDKLSVWTDGKKHYLALVMTTNSDSPIFWSANGKEFYQLRVFGGGSEGDDKNLK